MKRAVLLLAGSVFLHGCATPPKSARHSGPWDFAVLERTPATEKGARTGLPQEVYYEAEQFGK
jgi:hypothetical protein